METVCPNCGEREPFAAHPIVPWEEYCICLVCGWKWNEVTGTGYQTKLIEPKELKPEFRDEVIRRRKLLDSLNER